MSALSLAAERAESASPAPVEHSRADTSRGVLVVTVTNGSTFHLNVERSVKVKDESGKRTGPETETVLKRTSNLADIAAGIDAGLL